MVPPLSTKPCPAPSFCASLATYAHHVTTHVGHRLYRRGQGEVAREFHLPRVLVDIAEFTLLLGAPVLAVAKDRDEGAEGDDLMIRRSVGQVLEIVIRGFGNPYMRDHLPIHCQDKPAVNDVDEIG